MLDSKSAYIKKEIIEESLGSYDLLKYFMIHKKHVEFADIVLKNQSIELIMHKTKDNSSEIIGTDFFETYNEENIYSFSILDESLKEAYSLLDNLFKKYNLY